MKITKRALYARSSWPILWGHDHSLERQIEVLPDRDANVTDKSVAHQLWNGYTDKDGVTIGGAGRLHINRDFRVNSQALGACLTPQPALGGRSWPSMATDDKDWEKAIALWLNTTLGLISRWWVSSRQQKGRANLSITTIGNIPVLDLRALSRQQVKQLAQLCDEVIKAKMLPANEAYRDRIRQGLDEDVLCNILNLPQDILAPLISIREQWCAEPSVHGNKSTGLGV